MISYCFHSVDGYSKVGSYTGNGSTDGTFVYTGFRPAYVMTKRTNASYGWNIIDSTRDDDNVAQTWLDASDNSSENNNAVYAMDLTANGFKLRGSHSVQNGSGDSYIFIAFAESPFKNTNAR